jgi:hypothetical protein
VTIESQTKVFLSRCFLCTISILPDFPFHLYVMRDRFSKSNGSHAKEEQEWCRVTLGQVRALTRQYATEVNNSADCQIMQI